MLGQSPKAITILIENEENAMLGIIGAMDVEVDAIKEKVALPIKTTFAKIEFICGKIENTEVCIAQCSPGKVNAALCAQIMIDKFGVGEIINTGIGCSLGSTVKIRDVVIAKDVCQYDIDTTACGDEPGFISGLGVVKIKADAFISEALEKAAKRCGARVHTGTVASGDTFIASSALKEKTASLFGAVCGEMEGGAIGQVCYANGVPFAVLRTVSDGGNEAAEIDYPTFKKIAADTSAAIITEYLKA